MSASRKQGLAFSASICFGSISDRVERRGFIRSLATVITLTFGLTARGQGAQNWTRNASPQASMQEQAQKTFRRIGLTVPEYATIEFAEYQQGMDDNGRVILVMPTVDWEAMRAAPPLNEVPTSRYTTSNAGKLGTNKEGWHPRDDPSVVALQIPIKGLKGGPEYLNIGFAKAGADRVRVYIFWFQT